MTSNEPIIFRSGRGDDHPSFTCHVQSHPTTASQKPKNASVNN